MAKLVPARGPSRVAHEADAEVRTLLPLWASSPNNSWIHSVFGELNSPGPQPWGYRMVTRSNSTKDPIAEGAHARARRMPKDACPYPRNSEERLSWMEG